MLAPTLPDLKTLDRAALQALLLAEHAERLAMHRARPIPRSRDRTSQAADRQTATHGSSGAARKNWNARSRSWNCVWKIWRRNKQLPTPPPMPSNSSTSISARKPLRRPLPEHLPREVQTHQPSEIVCPDCGGALCSLGEDVSEMLEYVAARFHVIRHVRPKLSCTACDRIVQAAAPSRPIARGLAGPVCWRMYWSPSMPIICRSIDNQRFTPVKG
jgi:transposase